MSDKRTIAMTMKLNEAEVESFRKAGVMLYGKDHPVKPSTVVRELAKLGARHVNQNGRKR